MLLRIMLQVPLSLLLYYFVSIACAYILLLYLVCLV